MTDHTHEIADLHRRVTDVEKILLGEKGKLGMIGMVAVIWKTYIWLLCSLSAALGSLLTILIARIL